MGHAVAVKHHRGPGLARLTQQATDTGMRCAGDMETVVVCARSQVEHLQTRFPADDAIGQVWRRDVSRCLTRATGWRRVAWPAVGGERRQRQCRGDYRQHAMHERHGRGRSSRAARAKPASAIAVTAATPAPREIPTMSVNWEEPSGVLV